MPVLLDDDMLIPPSLRHKTYPKSNSVYTVSDSSSVIDLPPHTRVIEPITHRPVVIHHERYVSRPIDVEVVREQEYIIDSGGSPRYYRSRAPYEASGIRRGRPRSVDGHERDSYYLDDSSSTSGYGRQRREGGFSEGSVYREDLRSSRYSSPERYSRRSRRDSSRHRNNHHPHNLGRNVAEIAGAAAAGGLAGAAVHKLRRRSSSTSSFSSNDSRHHHVLRNTALAGAALEGGRRLHNHQTHQYDQHSDEHSDHRTRHILEAGLGVASLGAARELHKRRESRHRSAGKDDHTGRHVATAALGATAAGLAAHKYFNHSHPSEHNADDHRGRKVSAGLATATAAGIAAKHYYNQHEHRHRSRSSSMSSTSTHRHGNSHKLRNTAIGLGAAELAHRVHERTKSRSRSRPGILRRRSHSLSSSEDEHGRKIRNAALGLGALGAAELARRRHHKQKASRSQSHSRHGIPHRRSPSTSSSSDESSNHSRLRSRSRPGILRRRSKSVSHPYESHAHRGITSIRGESMKDNVHRRSSSADRHREGSVSNYGGTVGRIVSEAMLGALGGKHSHGQKKHHGGPKEAIMSGIAHKVGESMAENMLKKRAAH